MHGYELITELEARSSGRWRPSPGSIYPALTRMEEQGLLRAEELDEKQVVQLARILDELKTERAQSAVDDRRTLAEFADLLAFCSRMGLPPIIDSRHALANVTDALDRLESGLQFGKVVVTIGG